MARTITQRTVCMADADRQVPGSTTGTGAPTSGDRAPRVRVHCIARHFAGAFTVLRHAFMFFRGRASSSDSQRSQQFG